MGRHAEGPWYRAAERTWYATIGGKARSLGVRGKGNRAAARREWLRRLGAGRPDRPAAAPAPRLTAAEVVRRYHADLAGRAAPTTAVSYRGYRNMLARLLGDADAATLTGADANRLLAGPAWSPSTRGAAAGFLRAAFRWAVRSGLLARYPLDGLRRPASRSRAAGVVSPADYRLLLAAAGPRLRPLAVLLWETGARPSELTALTAADVDFASAAATLWVHKTGERTGRPRVVHLSPAALAEVRRLAAMRPAGYLLPGRGGRRWGRWAVCRAFRRASAAAGVKVTSYQFRHTLATRLLVAGVPDATVAALLGTSVQMVHAHYGRVASQGRALREALGRLTD